MGLLGVKEPLQISNLAVLKMWSDTPLFLHYQTWHLSHLHISVCVGMRNISESIRDYLCL